MRYKIVPVMVYLSTKYLLIELERVFDYQAIKAVIWKNKKFNERILISERGRYPCDSV